MTQTELSAVFELLNTADCLYTGKVLAECPRAPVAEAVGAATGSAHEVGANVSADAQPENSAGASVVGASTGSASVDDVQGVVSSAHVGAVSADDIMQQLSTIAQNIRVCTKCGLCGKRTNTVPGIGVASPLVLVVGEGPGADEDARGEPFVGKAGQLLDKMLFSIQLSRTTNCFIANVIKCRPPNNRDPAPDEMAACMGFLKNQIAVLRPKLILTLGRIATHALLLNAEPIGKIHGSFFEYRGIPLMPTYHPSALLRNEDLKRPAWEDLKTFRAKLLTIQSDYQTRFTQGPSL